MTDTKQIVLPICQKEAIIKNWITGRERESIESAQYSSIETEKVGDNKVRIKNVDVNAVMNAEAHKAIEVYVVSVDGKKENIKDTVLSLHETDYQAILDAIAESRKKK